MPSRLASASDRCFRFSCGRYQDDWWLRAETISAWRSGNGKTPVQDHFWHGRVPLIKPVQDHFWHGYVPLVSPVLFTAISHLLALIFFHLLLQESSCALAQLRLLPLHRKAALLLPLCRRCDNCIDMSAGHISVKMQMTQAMQDASHARMTNMAVAHLLELDAAETVSSSCSTETPLHRQCRAPAARICPCSPRLLPAARPSHSVVAALALQPGLLLQHLLPAVRRHQAPLSAQAGSWQSLAAPCPLLKAD
jgi:hypothetical protein